VKGFFGRMSFPRAVILFCSLGSLTLGALVYLRSRRLDEVHKELERVKEVVKEIQTDAYRLDDLQRSASTEKFKAQSELETYIRAIAGHKDINMGQIDIAKSTKSPARGIEDTIYKMSPQTKSQHYQRAQIGNFLYKLEFDSRRVKVTRLKLTPFDKVVPGEVGKDRWNFEADLTTRTKVDTAPAPADRG
jgi:hypothetical protein